MRLFFLDSALLPSYLSPARVVKKTDLGFSLVLKESARTRYRCVLTREHPILAALPRVDVG